MRTARVLIASLFAFLLLDQLIFNSRFYGRAASPDSTTGHLELILANEIGRPIEDADQILAAGNSRMGLLARVANTIGAKTGYTFASIANEGTTPRCWYYMLRAMQRAGRRYRAVILPLDDFEGAGAEDLAARDADQHYIQAELGVADIPRYAASFPSLSGKLGAARDVLLKGYLAQADFQDFLRDPRRRLREVRFSRQGSAQWFYDYIPPADNVNGLRIDWAGHSVEAPPGMSAALAEDFRSRLFSPPEPPDPRQVAYLRLWLGRIHELYRGSATQLILLRLPRGPYLKPDWPPPNPQSPVRLLAREPGVILDSEHTFDELENPALFRDAMHLNATGSRRFSILLARRVRALLGPPRQ